MKSAAIIVPVYNAETWLHQCLDSLLSQDYPNYEIILIDDCSPDHSLEICRQYQQQNPDRIRLIQNEENIGQGRSRMKAVESTDADYVFFVDSDDYIAPCYISRYMAELKDGDLDLVIGGFTKDIDGKLKSFPIADSDYTILLYSVACCKMYRRAFLIQNHIDFSDSRKGEDIFFSLMCFYHRPKYRIIDYQGYYYRLNRKSTTTTMTWQTSFDEIVTHMFRQFYARADLSRCKAEKKQKIEYCYIANMVNALTVYSHGCGSTRMKDKLNRFRQELRSFENTYGLEDVLQRKDLRFFRPRGISLRIRFGVGAFYWSTRLHLDGILFDLISRI